MSRDSNLGPLFHGARARIEGDMVLPPSVSGADTWSSRGYIETDGTKHTELAFSTPMEHVAWKYANIYPDRSDPDPRNRSRVYEVEPAEDQYSDGGEVFSRTGFRILREHLSRPGRQQTIDGINWNAFASTGTRDYNHWSNDDLPRTVPGPDPEPVHPDQLNLFSGRTASEHEVFERTPTPVIQGFPLGRHTVERPEEIALDPHSAEMQRRTTREKTQRILQALQFGETP